MYKKNVQDWLKWWNIMFDQDNSQYDIFILVGLAYLLTQYFFKWNLLDDLLPFSDTR